MVHVWPAMKIIVRRWFWTSKDIYSGAIVFFQIRRSWKSWGHRFFFCEKYWVSTWSKQDIIGWLQYFTEFVFVCVQWQPPCKLSTLRSMGVALLVYDNTTVPRWGHTIFDIKYGGHKILPRYLWKFMNPYSQVWWPHNSFIYVFFDKSNFKKHLMISAKFNLAIYIYFSHIYYCYRGALLRWTR